MNLAQLAIFNIVKNLIDNAEFLSQKPTHIRYLHFVQNDLYPNGVYRIHKQHFWPVYLELKDTEIKEINDEFCGRIILFDEGLWLTIFTS